MKKIILLLTLGLFTSLTNAQDREKDLANFEVTISTTSKDIILKSKNGGAWTKLTFSKTDQPQAVDEYGMTDLEDGKNKRKKSRKELADYTFTIQEKNGEVILQGIEGTAWEELTYTCDKKHCAITINAMGMK